ncbi:hypothetical protein [Negadavirga shengliensis]|uniref:DoxX family membrane protein n=1 Tax=Negadavirga shengliensis TaxID=1389218 RepID=A0ABV9T1G8_9BACT
MKPLIVLLVSFVIAVIAIKILRGFYDLRLSGRIAMSAMLLFTAIGHFVFTEGMSMMIPAFIPYKTELVYFTGAIEIGAAVGLLIPQLIFPTAWLLIAFFVLVLPANIHAAIHHIDFQKANLTGMGADYLWFRLPLQLLFIVWIYISAILAYK